MHLARVDQRPRIPESIGIASFHIKTFLRVVLQNGDGVVADFHQQLHGLPALLRGIKPVE